MRAVILAAGRGSRLLQYTADKPKGLLPVGGKPLLQRSMENLQKACYEHVSLVLGYKHEMIEQMLKQHFPQDFYTVILNPDWTRGSGSSLMCAASEFHGDVLIIESDLLYDYRVLLRMGSSEIKSAAMALGIFNHGRREVKIYLGTGITIKKAAWGEPNDKEANGEWVGFTRLSSPVSEALRDMLVAANPNQGREIAYEEFIFDLIQKYPFQAIPIQDLPWIEVDNETDYLKAEAEIIPKLDRLAKSAM